MIAIILGLLCALISIMYMQGVRILRYLYQLLGYHTSEHALAKAVLEMSNECPKKYLVMVMLLYSMVYTGCSECNQAGKEVFNSLLKFQKQVENAKHLAGYFNKIRDVLKKFKNQLPVTNELILSLQVGYVSLPKVKQFKRNLKSYFTFWIMASSLYCSHQSLTVNNTPNQICASTKRETGNSKSNVSASSKTTTSKVIKTSGQTRLSHNKPLSYPMSLLYALQSLPGRRIGLRLLDELTTLDIHVVTSNPLFDSETWKAFMNQLPNLTLLNVVFVIQRKALKKDFNPSNLQVKNCVMTCSVKQMFYHMYFSSLDYTDPDVVVVYDHTYEMSTSEKDDVHSEISYRNMTHNRDTVLVLMNETKELVRQGIKAVNAARPVEQLVINQIDPIIGLDPNHVELDLEIKLSWTKKKYFTCLRKK
ncbi:unnamed protein product [Meganyctiphanes norvegica]|uniref:Uncharacterized protein n=1 Tax=Meganyctiphanes norvegica TaxID=48144 RepID=A0AAV2SC48_MEGNR